MNTITINGQKIEVPNVTVVNGAVLINSVNSGIDGLSGIVKIEIEGSIGSLSVDKGDVACGDVKGHVAAGGDITCGNVAGSVNAGGDVVCKGINGNVNAGGDVNF